MLITELVEEIKYFYQRLSLSSEKELAKKIGYIMKTFLEEKQIKRLYEMLYQALEAQTQDEKQDMTGLFQVLAISLSQMLNEQREKKKKRGIKYHSVYKLEGLNDTRHFKQYWQHGVSFRLGGDCF